MPTDPDIEALKSVMLIAEIPWEDISDYDVLCDVTTTLLDITQRVMNRRADLIPPESWTARPAPPHLRSVPDA